MVSSIKSFYISYDAVNESNTFGAGDFISGRIFLEVSKEVKLSSLSVKAKGKAKVLWSERYGQVTVVYHAKEKYFSQERVLVQERAAGGAGEDYMTLINQGEEKYDSVLSPGIHVYSFTFQIPQGNMPSSFKGCYGKIIYTLEAKLSRPMRVSSKAMAEFTFVSKPDVSIAHLMEPQFGTRSKNLKFLTSGNVSMDIQTEKMGYMQGEVLQVVAQINNISSRIVTPKISLYQKQSFFAKGKRKLYIKKILKEKGESIPPGTHRSVTQQLTIPVDLPPSVLNCPILQVEYRLKVYLNVPFAKDPEIKLPLIVLHALSASGPMTQLNTPECFT
ncbi:arrestin domain-containing protein 3-like [Scleropages formosus]|uniref:arrestin domain-containing protein 3-like n=1 Tax=Scleropages formosus TaxID=113540 RepID=UPI000878EC36|nr:arrestin domain-containing protein 3-like [Scleropages formosus]